MNIKILSMYMSLCSHFGLEPNFEHLKRYNKKIMEGLNGNK